MWNVPPQVHVWTPDPQLWHCLGRLWNHWHTGSSKQELSHWRWDLMVISEFSACWAPNTLGSCVGSPSSHSSHLAFLPWWTEPFETVSRTNLSSSQLFVRYFFHSSEKRNQYNALVPVPLKLVPILARGLFFFFSPKCICNSRVILQTTGVCSGPKSVQDWLVSLLRG